MDDRRFDALTRALRSRRSALAGVLGVMASLLSRASSEEVAAHNPLPRCRRLRDPVQRHLCLRHAREHNRRHRTCRSITLAAVCRYVECGWVGDACGRNRNCGGCGAGRACVNNTCTHMCADPLSTEGPPCPPGCVCASYCVRGDDPNLRCDANSPRGCSLIGDTVDPEPGCPVGSICVPVSCRPGTAEGRCVAACG